MSIRLVPARPEHADALATIFFDAFAAIQDDSGSPRDVPTREIAGHIMEMLLASPAFYGLVALADDGRPVGSNFLGGGDEAAGVGPIAVDPALQGRGIGRLLMEDVLRHARTQGIARVRLMQDSFNMASLCLYASLGFAVKKGVALMVAEPAGKDDASIRPLAEDDLPAVEEIGRRLYGISRRDAVAAALQGGMGPLLRERNAQIVGYFVPGFIGHGVAETDDDALALVRQAARTARDRRFFCPLRQAGLFRRALAEGCRAIKVMNLMALGPYEEPRGVWMPSVGF